MNAAMTGPAAGFVLHGHHESGNCYKVALLLALAGAGFSYRHVALFEGATRVPGFAALNRFGEVPVLEHAGRTLVQSGVILGYLADHFGRFHGRDLDERLRVAEWLAWENQRVLTGVALLRYIRRFQPDTAPAVVDFLRPRAERALDTLARAVEAAPFLVGDRATIADVACFAYVSLMDEAGLEGARWPAVGRWLERVRALPGWRPMADLLPRG